MYQAKNGELKRLDDSTINICNELRELAEMTNRIKMFFLMQKKKNKEVAHVNGSGEQK